MNIEEIKKIITDYADANGYVHPEFIESTKNFGTEFFVIKFDKVILFEKPKEQSVLKMVSSTLTRSAGEDFDKVKEAPIENMTASFNAMMPNVLAEIRMEKSKIKGLLITTKSSSKEIRDNNYATIEGNVKLRIPTKVLEKMSLEDAQKLPKIMDILSATCHVDENIRVTREKSIFMQLITQDDKKLWGANLANVVIKRPEVESGLVATAANTAAAAAAVAVGILIMFGAVMMIKDGFEKEGKGMDLAGDGKYFKGAMKYHQGKHEVKMGHDVLLSGAELTFGTLATAANSSTPENNIGLEKSGGSSGLATQAKLKFQQPTSDIKAITNDINATTTNVNSATFFASSAGKPADPIQALLQQQQAEYDQLRNNNVFQYNQATSLAGNTGASAPIWYQEFISNLNKSEESMMEKHKQEMSDLMQSLGTGKTF